MSLLVMKRWNVEVSQDGSTKIFHFLVEKFGENIKKNVAMVTLLFN